MAKTSKRKKVDHIRKAMIDAVIEEAADICHQRGVKLMHLRHLGAVKKISKAQNYVSKTTTTPLDVVAKAGPEELTCLSLANQIRDLKHSKLKEHQDED